MGDITKLSFARLQQSLSNRAAASIEEEPVPYALSSTPYEVGFIFLVPPKGHPPITVI